MKINIRTAWVILAWFLATAPLTAESVNQLSESLHFAQFGKGADLLFSQIILQNGDPTTPALVQLTIRDDNGNPMDVVLNGTSTVGGRFETNVPAGGIVSLQTGVSGSLAVGSVTALSDRKLHGMIVFGGSTGLAAVPSSAALSEGFSAPLEFSSSQGIKTGVAVQNLDTARTTLQLQLVDVNGGPVATTQLEIPALGHAARFVDELTWSPTVVFAEFRGILRVTSDHAVAATAIQTRPNQLATLPVVSNALNQTSQSLYFAQFGKGADLLFSQIILMNGDLVTPASVQITIRDESGNPVDVVLNGTSTVSGKLATSVPARGMVSLQTDIKGNLVVGSVTVLSDRKLHGLLVFGGSTGLAGVPSSAALAQGFFAPIEFSSSQGINTGIAVQNLDAAKTAMQVQLVDTNGTLVAKAQLEIPGFGHVSRFVNELAWTPTVFFGEFRGVLRVTSDHPLAATALQTRPNQLLATPVNAYTGPPSFAIAIDKPSVFFPATGLSTRLTAQARDAAGATLPVSVTWRSTAADKVAVDSTGLLTAKAIGSAQIFAESSGVRSAPTVVVVAEPKPGALLVTDAQVVSVGPPLGLAAGASPGVGTEYEVTLKGVSAPTPGTVVLAAETAPVAGKVVSTRQEAAGLVVKLALAPLYQLFTAYDIQLTIDLAAFPLEALAEHPAPGAQGVVWNGAQSGGARALATVRPLAAFEPFRAFKCDGSIEAQIASKSIQLSLENNLKLVLDDRPGYSKHALEGSADLVGSASVNLKAGFKGSGRCDAQARINLPIGGWVSLLAMPAVRFGLGAELSGEILLVQGELGVEGRVGFSPVLGWECGGATLACRGLDGIQLTDKFETKSKIPSKNDMQAKVSGQFYVVAGLDLSILAGTLNGGILEARIGPKQSFDLAFEEDQAARTDYAAKYDLKLEGVVEPGSALKKAIELVIDDDSTSVEFKAGFTTDISESPKGSLSASKSRVPVGSAVDFTVDLIPRTMEYWILGYNVTGVELYRKREDELDFKPWKSAPQIASNRFTYKWQTTNADVGKYEFAAVVNTHILTPLLEVAPNSIQPVEVSCFSAGATKGALSAPQAANTCADTWVGTATYIAKTPGAPTINFTATSNITWTYDPALSYPGATAYTPTGTFQVKFPETPECQTTISPDTFTIVNDPLTRPALWIFNLPFVSPTYGFSGSQLVKTTSTVSCPGKTDVVTFLDGMLVFYAYGQGPFTDPLRLSGSFEDAATTAKWDFARP